MKRMVIQISDDFDLEKISLSGQCFRVQKSAGEVYRFIHGEHILYIQKKEENQFTVSCSQEEWKEIWQDYFDLKRSYRAVFERETGKNKFVSEAMAFGRGLRILHQDPWEVLLTFIISQRKSIPAISRAAEALALKFGHKIETAYETLYSFPSPSDLADATESDLAACGLGYRTPYILDAVSRVSAGTLNLDALSACTDEQLLKELQKIYGVGKKIANCVALFAYGRTACVPVDVWISRAIEKDCAGESPFGLYGENAGIIQQYIFYYERKRPVGS